MVAEQPRAARERAAGSIDTAWVLAMVVLTVGILVHGVTAPLLQWVPSGDDGYWSIMARSVFSDRPPLLGSSSSGGLVAGTGYHHIGPLGFYLLAPFVLVLGSVGVAVGAAVLNAVAAAGAAAVVRRGVGELAGWAVLVASALLAFTMGSELLVDPWNPHLVVMSCWAALCCTWAVVSGSPWAAVPGTLFASLVLQTHLSFAPLAAVLVVVLVVGVVVIAVRNATAARGSTAGRDATSAAALRRWAPLLATVAVGLVSIAPVLIEQFAGAGPGNLSNVIEGGAGQDEPIGLSEGLAALAQPVVPTNWGPGAWVAQVVPTDELAVPWLAVGLGLVLVLVVWLSWTRLDRRAAAGPLLALGLLVVSVPVAANVGRRELGVPMTLTRWAWPLVLFAVVVSVISVVGLWRSRTTAPTSSSAAEPSTGASRVLRWCGLGLVLVLSAANLVPRDEGSGAKQQYRTTVNEVLDRAAPTVAELGRPAIVVNYHPLAAETTVALMDWLDERGVEFGLDDPVALRQAGEHRTLDGTETATVVLRGGAAALEPAPPGWRTELLLVPLDAEELRAYRRGTDGLDERLADFVERLSDDAALRRSVGVDEAAPERLSTMGWSRALCGDFRELPLDDAEVQGALVDDDLRSQLCGYEARLDRGAVAVDIGPPPAATP
jgi:hypothetical protein